MENLIESYLASPPDSGHWWTMLMACLYLATEIFKWLRARDKNKP